MSAPSSHSGPANPVGWSAPRVDAVEKVTGRAQYPGDLNMEGQLWMKVVFAGRPHARILQIEPAEAKELPGVVAVLTARDVPHNHYGLEEADQPVLCDRVVRWEGDRVALVVAESEALAARAAGLVRVDYADLPVLDSPQAALAHGAPALHPDKPDNVLVAYHVENGDIAQGFRQSDVILDESYRTGPQEHAYLQPDAGLAWIDDRERLILRCAGQSVRDDRRQIAQSLDLPESAVQVSYAAIGGAFGGREDLNLNICLALAAWKTRRPVKAVWTRAETAIGHPKRHPMSIRHRWGASTDGRLLAQEIEITADAGAYASTSASVLGTTVMMSTGPYACPNVRVEARAVYTNNPVSGAFRGFGAPQAVFAAERHMDRLAAALGVDPVELRLVNLVGEGSQTAAIGCLPPGVSACQTLKAAARSLGWEENGGHWRRPRPLHAGDIRRGVGIAAGWKPLGYPLGWPEEAAVTISLHGDAEIESAVLHTDVADLGQGAFTVLCQIAAQALGLPLERIRLSPQSTDAPVTAGTSAASRVTLIVGQAVLGAAAAALRAWKNEERPAIASYCYRAPPTHDFSDLGHRKSAAVCLGYCAQAAVIALDCRTGRISIERLVSAHQVGKAINPQAVEGQVQGGALQGLGWAAMEDPAVRRGNILNTELSNYLIPTSLDIPTDFDTILLEDPSPLGPLGAVGIGEMPLLAVAPAIAAALHDASGVWISELPLIPERVWRALW